MSKADIPSAPEDPERLARWICTQIDEADIQAIAESDVPFADEIFLNRKALLPLVAARCRIEERLEWNPKEVFELVRWNFLEPGDVPGHRQRLFSCICLLNAAATPQNQDHCCSVNESMITLIDSVLTTFPTHAPAAYDYLRLLRNRLDPVSFADEAPHLPLGCLVVASLDCNHPDLSQLLEDVVSAIQATKRTAEMPIERDFDWLLNFGFHDQCRAMWETHLELAERRLRAHPPSLHLADRLHYLITRRN